MNNSEKIREQFKEWYYGKYGYGSDGYYPEEIREIWMAGYNARNTYIHFMREQVKEMQRIISNKHGSF